MDSAGLILFTVGPCLLITLYLGFVLLFRLQIHLFELMVTLLASTLPLGAILSHMNNHRADFENEDWVKALAIGCVPFVFFFAGSVWGMSAIKRLEIGRP